MEITGFDIPDAIIGNRVDKIDTFGSDCESYIHMYFNILRFLMFVRDENPLHSLSSALWSFTLIFHMFLTKCHKMSHNSILIFGSFFKIPSIHIITID